MALPAGTNFRDTAGFVTDGTNETYCIIGADGYPTTRGGNTFGWSVSSFLAQSRDRNAALDRRLAGINRDDFANCEFRFDLPSAGSYLISLALGDTGAGGASTVNCAVKDDSSTLTTVSGADAADNCMDATGVVRTDAAWPAANAKYTGTFATSILRLGLAGGATPSIIRHVNVASGVTFVPNPPPIYDTPRQRYTARDRQRRPSPVEAFETIAPEQFAQTLLPSADYDDRTPRRARRLIEYPSVFETIAPEQFAVTLLWGSLVPDGRLLRPKRLIELPSVFQTLAQETFNTQVFQADYTGPPRPIRARRLTEYLASFGTIAPEQFARDLLASVTVPDSQLLRARRPREYPFTAETIAPEQFAQDLLAGATLPDTQLLRARRLREYPFAAPETIAPEQFAVTLWWGFSATADRPVRARHLIEYPFSFWSSFTPGAAVAPDLCMTVLPADPRRTRRSPVPYLPIAPWLVRVPPGSTLKDFDFLGPHLPPTALRRLRVAIQQFMMPQGETPAIALVPDHGFREPEVRDEYLTTPFAFDIMWVDTEDGGEFLIRPYGR